MTESQAKKLGEVLAFCREGAGLFERTREVLQHWISVDPILSSLSQQEEDILAAAREASCEDTVTGKAEKTGTKLRSMRDLYLASEEDWENPQEIMEWLGFFEGAAVVHWKLVFSFAEPDSNLALVSSDAASLHSSVLENVGNAIQKVTQ